MIFGEVGLVLGRNSPCNGQEAVNGRPSMGFTNALGAKAHARVKPLTDEVIR